MPPRLSRSRFRSFSSRVKASLRTRAHHAALVVNPAAFSGRIDSPADFSAWAERTGRAAGFPDEWRMLDELPLVTTTRVGVVVHAFYRGMVDEIVEQLASIPIPFDLFVTNASGEPLVIDRVRLPQARGLIVLDVENRGRDILPLVCLVNAGLLDPYQLILKVHTKRSAWREDHLDLPGSGSDWRRGLLADLLGDESNVRAIVNAFATTPDLGLVTADGSLLGPQFWGDNETVTAALLRRVELDLRPAELTFPAGSMYWIRGFVLQGLRAFNLEARDFEIESAQVNATTAHAVERLIGVITREAGLTAVGRSALGVGAATDDDWRRFDPSRTLRPRLRLVPFYLPQFHPIPENDRWWGRGFTEWSNVAAAKPVYLGHHQPKLPTDTGFYDLRLEATVRMQVSLAQAAGINGFMYYHYWFGGIELLADPIRARIAGDIDMPFCLMWANENWTRRWDGRDSEILMGQRYAEVPADRFLDDTLPILRDPRYMKIEGRPIVAIYRPGQLPNVAGTIAAWRETAQLAGIPDLFVIQVDVAREFHGVEHSPESGLDGILGFPPHNGLWDWLPHQHVGATPGFAGNILSYRALAEDAIRKLRSGIPETSFPGVLVNFDNTARRQANPDIWFGSNPFTFRRWLAAAAAAVAHRDPEHRIVFINAWNEWAEGAILEPNDRFGSTFLLAVRDVALG